jgi:ATP-dependent helicase HrpA
VRFVLGRQTNQAKLTLSRYRHGSATELFDDCLAAAADDLIERHGGPAWDEAGFRRLYDAVRGELADATLDVVTRVERVLAVAGEVEGRMAGLTSPAFGPALDDLRGQLDDLVYPGWVTATGRRRLPDVLRYLRAMLRRLDRLPGEIARDAELMESVAHVTRAWERLLDLPPGPHGRAQADLTRIRWLLEELRVSYWAQTLGTAQPVSEKRVLRAIDQLGG